MTAELLTPRAALNKAFIKLKPAREAMGVGAVETLHVFGNLQRLATALPNVPIRE